MRLLLDTHTLLWWAHEPAKLSRTVLDIVSDERNEVLVSAVSAMEISSKNRLGRLEYPSSLADQFLQRIDSFGFAPFAIEAAHAQHAGSLPGENRDPWDRLLAAQAELGQMPLVSKDTRMADWNVQLIW